MQMHMKMKMISFLIWVEDSCGEDKDLCVCVFVFFFFL